MVILVLDDTDDLFFIGGKAAVKHNNNGDQVDIHSEYQTIGLQNTSRSTALEFIVTDTSVLSYMHLFRLPFVLFALVTPTPLCFIQNTYLLDFSTNAANSSA